MTDSLAEALAELQLKLPVIRKAETGKVEGQNKEGKHFSYEYKYADLAGISAAIMPLMGELGLSFMARPMFVGEPPRFALVCTLMHVSGGSMEAQYPLPQQGTPQQIGSAITYGRRYCLCAMTGVAPEDDDDDARAASAAAQRREETKVELAADVQRGRDEVRSAWAVSFGTSASECAEYYARWSKGRNLWDADGPELRRYASYLVALPQEVAGSDPAQVPAGDEQPRIVTSPRPLTPAMRTKINAIMSKLYGRDREARLGALSQLVGRDVKSSSDLSYEEGRQVIDELESAEAPGGPWEQKAGDSRRSGEPGPPGQEGTP